MIDEAKSQAKYVIDFIRGARDEAESLGEHIMLFIAFLITATAIGCIAAALIFFVFTMPKFFIPLYFAIFILWQGYKRL